MVSKIVHILSPKVIMTPRPLPEYATFIPPLTKLLPMFNHSSMLMCCGLLYCMGLLQG